MATGDAIELTAVEPKKPAVLSQEVSFSDNAKVSKQRGKLARRYTDLSQTSEISRRLNVQSERRFNADERKRQRWERFNLNCFYFEWMVGNPFMRLMFRLLSFVNLLSLIFNSMPVLFRLLPWIGQEDNVNIWLYYYYTLFAVDCTLALVFTLYLVGRGVNSCYWKKHSSKPIDLASYYHWSRLVIIAIITLALYYSVTIEAYRLACIHECQNMVGDRADMNTDGIDNGDPPFVCSGNGLHCPPHETLYIPFIIRLLSLFSAMRALAPFQRLRISNSVWRELTRYLKVKHLLNVAIFYALMVFIYAVIGVNVIGPLTNRCVDVEGLKRSANTSLDCLKTDEMCCSVENFYNPAANESRLDGLRRLERHLAIPDLHCSRNQTQTFCPSGLECVCVNFERNRVYQADYPHLGTALLSVYESSTLELWTRTLYDAIDGEQPPEALLFFFSIVFFLVILVQESIFLVVIIESFAAVRSESYIAKKKIKEGPNQYLVDEGDGKLRLVQKEDSAHSQWTLKYRRYLVWFHKAMLILVMVDAIVMATRSSCSRRSYTCDRTVYGCYLFVVALWQLLVSFVFVVEVVVYLVYYGPRKFFKSRLYWGLSILAVVGLASAIVEIATAMLQEHEFTCGGIPVPGLPTYTPLIVAQAIRLVRLLSLYGPLHKFAQQVVGKGNRIYLVIFGVLSFIFIMAVINVQFFAFVNRDDDIDVFPDIILGFQSQFQLLFQEGWIELLSELMHWTDNVWWLVNIWILLLHFLASLVLLNFFTAIILDNLDLDEETKVQRLKEALAAETVQEETIPRHWKWSTRIGGGAETVKVPEQSGFDGPAVKKSVMQEYLERGETRRMGEYITVVGGSSKGVSLSPWKNQGSDEEEEDFAIHFRLQEEQSRLRLVSTPDSGGRDMRPLIWGQRERQQSVGHLVQQIKLLRKLRRFDVSETVKESTTRKAIRISRRSNTSGVRKNKMVEEYRRNHRCFDRALFCMSPGHPVRRFANQILYTQLPEPALKTTSSSRVRRNLQRFWYYVLYVVSVFPFFKWFMLLTTVALMIMQFLEGLFDTTSCPAFKATGDGLFVLLTLGELILKIVAHGLLFNPYAAISSVFDVMDWVIVMATFVRFIVLIVYPTALDPQNFNLRQNWEVALLLVLWSLRPFRIISIVPQVREVLTDVWRGRKKFFFAIILFIGFVFIFSSLFTQLFSGALGKCNDIDVWKEEDCIGEFNMSIHSSFDIIIREPRVNITVPRVWITEPRDFQFDNIILSFVTLFSLLPLEGWIALRDYVDVRVDIHQDIHDFVNRLELKTFLHLYVFIGANLGLTLFVGVIVANYNENRSNHAALLTVGQKQWLDLLQRIQLTAPKKIPPAPPYTKRVAYFLYSLVNDFHHYRYCQIPKWIRPFRAFSVAMIIFNALTLCVRWRENLDLVEVAIGFSIAFNVWFIVEQFLKMVAFGVKPYFYSFRNWADTILSVYSAVYCVFALVVLFGNSPNDGQGFALTYENIADMALASAVLRCFTILGKYEVLSSISVTVVVALLNSISLMILMVVVLLVYAYWGTALFHQVTKGEGIELRHATFRTHNLSLFLGIRILTGEDWYQLMWDAAVEPPYCRPDLSNCGQTVVSSLYFLSFFFILFFIILNIFKAVLLEAFSVFYSEDDTKLNHTFLKRFRNHWSKFDPTAKGIIPLRQARFLIRSLAVQCYYSYRVKDSGERERVEVDMTSDALVLREMYHELVLTVAPNLKLTEDSDWHPEQRDVDFASVLRMLAYKAEDMHKRLKPDELMEREVLEQSIQDEVAAHCIHLWMKRYLKPVVDNFSMEADDQSFPQEGQGPVSVVIHQSSLPTDTDDEGDFPPRPQNLPLLPAKVKGQDGPSSVGHSTLSPHTAHGPQTMLPALARREPQPVDPNHIWLEQQMQYDSDDDALFDL